MNRSDTYQWPLNSGPLSFALADLTAGTGVPALRLPPGAVVTAGAVVVQTAFNSATTASLAVGDGDDPNRYGDIDLSTTGRKALTLTGHMYNNPDDLELLFTETGTAATEGEGFIELEIIMEGRVSEAVT